MNDSESEINNKIKKVEQKYNDDKNKKNLNKDNLNKVTNKTKNRRKSSSDESQTSD
jgi:hypothetical protein